MWDVGGAGRLLNEQVYSGHPHLQHFHCNMTNVLDLDLAQLSCIWGIWSCIDELNWVTAESALVKVRWKGVKWRASTWASWPLSGREDMERDQKGEPAEIWFVRSCISKLQGWVSEVFSLAWNPVIKTLHPVSDLLTVLLNLSSLYMVSQSTLSCQLKFPNLQKVWDCTLSRGGMRKIYSVPTHPCDHLCSQ